jgi:hypothetical protein
VRVAFVPPTVRRVGETGVGAVVMESDVDVPSATVRVTPRAGLQVTNAGKDGVVWSGRLPAKQHTTVPVRMRAAKPGAQGLTVRLSSEMAEANATMSVTVPGFAKAAPAKASASHKQEPRPKEVSLVFHETEIREALYAVGRQTGQAIEVAPEVQGQRVNADLRDVPVEAALRIICEGTGYRFAPQAGGYKVTKP